ncbi:isoprenyl transferase [Candidatus Oscillochloris fontis]|uniref:isoprenyl transferase n=1 Tax=Candidatus Oscillochloris fontis TaxID=2496868 RepID=UPI00101B87C7|nr:isoprenyl transferase [Candidatus Oscillochloris fontis]
MSSTESTLEGVPRIPAHIAIIMDGNGRWAQQRGQPRMAGHRAGTENIRSIVSECDQIGVRYLTIYAFSTENWNRPSLEVQGLMQILGDFIDRETKNLHAQQVRLRHLGRLSGLSPRLRRKVQYALDLTQHNTGLTLAVAFNYGGRADIVDATRELITAGVRPEEIDEQMISDHLYTRGMPDPDIVIRTSGERRISNFMIWQAAYSEYWFTPVLWPDFRSEHIHQAIRDYGRRERRFGGLSEQS